MNFKKILCNYIILLPLIFSLNFVICDTYKINDIIQCYSSNYSQPGVQNTLQVLIELIRKIEDDNPTSLTIRQLSVQLLHQLRVDGIGRSNIQETHNLIPYHQNGFMKNKFKLLLRLISNTPSAIKFENTFNIFELCTLHRLLSSSVDPFKRGDENKICPIGIKDYVDEKIPADKVLIFDEKSYVVPQSASKCPIERGVIRTYEYGSVSPGIIIASIAAGLQPQSVELREIAEEATKERNENLETMEIDDQNKNIRKYLDSIKKVDNRFSANLAGDLAEVCVYQVPYYKTNVSVGTPGFWNDLEYPLRHYVSESNPLRYAMTDSEILSGIDGYYIAKNIDKWVNRIQRFRLSQVLEMFYSFNGIPNFSIETNRKRKLAQYETNYRFSVDDDNPLKDGIDEFLLSGNDDTFYNRDLFKNSACERRKVLNYLPRDKLKDETFNFANILQYTTATVIIDNTLLKKACDATVDRFYERAKLLVNQDTRCENLKRPAVDLTLIIDGFRNKFGNTKLISYLSEIIDVSTFSSRLAVIHGQNAEHLITPTRSIVKAFEQLANYSGSYPTSLSLSLSLTTFFNGLNSFNENDNNEIVQLSKVLMIVSQSQEIRQNDFDEAKRLLEKHLNADRDLDIYLMIVTNSAKTFQDLLTNIPKEKFIIIESSATNPKSFTSDTIPYLRSIPKHIKLPSCGKTKQKAGEFLARHESEQYLNREKINYYRINSNQLKQFSSFRVQFQGVEYGKLTICKIIETDLQCSSTSSIPDESIWFDIENPCNDVDGCKPINFKVELDSSLVKCTESTCRYPDDVRFFIRIDDTKCLNGSSAKLSQINYVVNVFLIIIIFIFYLN